MGNGLLNAAVEMGGGIQTLPAQLQGGKSAWRAWVEGMVDEGKEEVVQGILQRSLQNAIYQQDNPLFSTTDEGAILNPKTAAEEFAGGAAVGGILGGGQALILSRRAARPAEEYLTEREGILRDLATQKVQGEMELARRRAAPRELIRPETARELLATLGERGERAFRAAYQQESGLLPSFREFAKAYNQGLRGEPKTAVEPGRSIDTMAGYFAGQNDAAADSLTPTTADSSAMTQSAAPLQTQKTAPTRRAEISDYQKEEHHGEILDTVRAHLSDVSSLSPVAALTGQEFQKTAKDSRSLRVRVIEFFNSIGNKVTRKDLGDIALNTSGVRDSLGHGYGKLKAVTFAALPQVLEQGKIIAHNGPYEGHWYDSYIISAPVRIGKETAYVGALVIRDREQRYKLHEVLMASQSGAPLFQTEATSQGASGPLRNDAPLGAPGGAPTPKSIAQIGGRDNSKIPQAGRSDALGIPEQDAAMGAKEALLTVGRRMTEAERAELEALHAREDSLTREEKARYRELLSRRIEEALYWGGTEP